METGSSRSRLKPSPSPHQLEPLTKYGSVQPAEPRRADTQPDSCSSVFVVEALFIKTVNLVDRDKPHRG